VSSWLYSHRIAYHMLMRMLYGRHLAARSAAVVAEVPAGSVVVDVCSGDGQLYRRYLRSKPIRYQALDISPRLVEWMSQHGIQARQFDVRREALPGADVVIMQSSLYQFLPDAAPVVDRLLRAARSRVIITEPVRNFAASENPVLRFVGRRLTRPDGDGAEYRAHRFDSVSFSALCQQFPTLERLDTLPGGREMIAVFGGCALSDVDDAQRHPG
jgi:hypothetical protein